MGHGRITAVRLDRSLNTLVILKQCLLILLVINVTIIIGSFVGKKNCIEMLFGNTFDTPLQLELCKKFQTDQQSSRHHNS